MNVVIVAQRGRLALQALLFAETYVRSGSAARNPLFVAVPEPGNLWEDDPTPEPAVMARLTALGARIVTFRNEHFGSRSPYTNKVYALFAIPQGEPFMFLDSDQLIFRNLTDIPLDFSHPSARLAAAAWPPNRSSFPKEKVWRAVYRLAGGDAPANGAGRYFNAGCYYHEDPHVFGQLMLDCCLALSSTQSPPIAEQPMLPAPLDQVALSAVIARIGEGQPCPETLNSIHLTDTTASWHYHRFARFWLPGYERARDLLEEILQTPDTAALLAGNETIQFFRSPLGRQVAEKADRFVHKHQAKLNMRDAGKLMRQLGFD
jgi:hypothetical protein